MLGPRDKENEYNRRLIEREVKKLIDAGLVCMYDGDHLKLTEYGMQVAGMLRREENARLKGHKRRF